MDNMLGWIFAAAVFANLLLWGIALKVDEAVKLLRRIVERDSLSN